MVESIGKKLCQARLARGLSIEEAAHETRVRPDKLLALENDDYSRFGSNAYAKGFLQLYGRFLDVNVTSATQHLETPRQVTISDYQYLNNAAEVKTTKVHIRRNNGSNRPSILPLVIMLGLMLTGASIWVGYLFNVTSKRLEPGTAKAGTTESPIAEAPAGTNAAPSVAVQDSATPEPRITQPELTPSAGTAAPVPGDTEVRRAEPVNAGAVGTATPTAAIHEIIVEPIKKTWVKVRRDGPTAPAIFEDFVYPGASPLKLRGASFYVEVQDQDAVQIRKNGTPIAYRAPGISIR